MVEHNLLPQLGQSNQKNAPFDSHKAFVSLLGIFLLLIASITFFQHKYSFLTKLPFFANKLDKDVLAVYDIVPYTELQSNLKYVFNNSAEVLNGMTIRGDVDADGSNVTLGEGTILASNIIYSLIAGDGVIISPGQNPVISLATPVGGGVQSIEGISGAVDLVAGSNISLSIDGNQLTINASSPSISDTNTTYSAGEGLALTDATFSVDFNGIGLSDFGTSNTTSGASVIGVYTGNFVNISVPTPGTDLQSVLEAIDNELSVSGGGGISAIGNISFGPAFTAGVPGSNLFIADTGWIGLGSGAGRIMWNDAAIDTISFLNSNIGIGTTAPDDALDVVGNIDLSGNIEVNDRLFFKTSAPYNVILGYDAGASLAPGSIGNIFIGNSAGSFLSGVGHGGDDIIAIGNRAMAGATWGIESVIIGTDAIPRVTWPTETVVIGYRAGYNAIEGMDSTVLIGKMAGYTLREDTYNNVLIGSETGWGIETGLSNTVVGAYAGRGGPTDEGNVYMGNAAGADARGDENTVIGYVAARYLGGNNNAVFGALAGYGLNGQSYFGADRNVLIGDHAGYNLSSNADNNTLIGYGSGFNIGTSDVGNVFLGYQSGYNETGSNKLYIENSNAGPTGALIYGDFATDTLTFNANVGIGTTNPAYRLDVAGNIRAGTEIYKGSIALGATGTSNTTSGASVIGVYDEFDYSNASTVQDVLDDLDAQLGIHNTAIGSTAYSSTNYVTAGDSLRDAISDLDTALGALSGGSDIWTDGGSFLFPTGGEYLGNMGVGATGKLAGAYFSDNSLLAFGTDNDYRMLFNGTSFILGDTANTFLSIGDSGTTANFAFNVDDFYIRGDGNIGIGTTNPDDALDVVGVIDTDSYYKLGGYKILDTANMTSLMVGISAGSSLTTGEYNTLFGYGAGSLLTDQSYNTMIGYMAGANANFIGTENIFIGSNAGGNATGNADSNILLGNGAGYMGLSGNGNILIGRQAGYNMTSGSWNTFIGGYSPGSANTTGSDNVFLGDAAGHRNVTGNENVILGSGAGMGNYVDYFDASRNTMIGYMAGYKIGTSDVGNVYLGYQAGYNETGSNKLYIENSNAGPTGALIYGDFATDTLTFNASVGIGTTAPQYTLDVAGNIRAGTDIYIGNIALGGTGISAITSGASVIGVFDEFTYSSGTNVQDVLDDLDIQLGIHNAAIGSTAYSSTNYVTAGSSLRDAISALDAAIAGVSVGASLWTDGGNYLYPTGNEFIGNSASGGANKLAGIYLGDTSPIVFGTNNNFDLRYGDNKLTLGDGTNTFLAVGDSGTTGNFNFNNGQLFLRGDGNIGIGVSDPTDKLVVAGNIKPSQTDQYDLGGVIFDSQPDISISTAYMADVGDLNNDGYNDVVIYSDGNIEIYLGSDGFDNIADITFSTISVLNIKVGDVNGDGFDDILLADYSSPYSVRVYYGGSSIDGVADLTFNRVSGGVYSQHGDNMVIADFNGDGYDDIAISDYFADSGGYSNNGEVYIYHGGPSIDTTPDLVFAGINNNQYFGRGAIAGDINDDGYADLLITNAPSERLEAALYYGGASMDSTPDLLFGSPFLGWADPGVFFDYNADGIDDLILMRLVEDPWGELNYTQPVVYFGSVSPDNEPDLISGKINTASINIFKQFDNNAIMLFDVENYGDDEYPYNLYNGGTSPDFEQDSTFIFNSYISILADINGDTYPDVITDDGTIYFGMSPARWRNIYANNLDVTGDVRGSNAYLNYAGIDSAAINTADINEISMATTSSIAIDIFQDINGDFGTAMNIDSLVNPQEGGYYAGIQSYIYSVEDSTNDFFDLIGISTQAYHEGSGDVSSIMGGYFGTGGGYNASYIGDIQGIAVETSGYAEEVDTITGGRFSVNSSSASTEKINGIYTDIGYYTNEIEEIYGGNFYMTPTEYTPIYVGSIIGVNTKMDAIATDLGYVAGFRADINAGGSSTTTQEVVGLDIGIDHFGTQLNNRYGIRINELGGEADNDYAIYSAATQNSYLAGALGIGTTTLTSKFAIDALGSNTGTNLVIDANGDVWKDSSSLRYKDDVTALVGPFDKIYELEPVTYRFKGTNNYTIGYIAEDLHTLGLTDLVVYDNSGRPDAIKYDRLSLYNLELLKEQKSDLKDLSNLFSSSQSSFSTQDTRILGVQNDIKSLNKTFLSQKEEIAKLQQQMDDLFDIVHNLDKTATQEADISSLTERVSFLEQMLFGQEASESASLAQTQEEEDILGVSTEILENLTVTGKTNLFDVGIVGNMSVGQIVVRGNEAVINSLALPLELQSEASAPVEIMAGKISIDTQGNLTVKETVKAKKFEVDKTDKKSASAGKEIIKAGTTKIEIKTTALTPSSLIFATPKGIPVSVATEATGPTTFELLLDKKLEEDVEINWWLVN